MPPPLSGFHHATSFAGNPQTDIDFHATALGMRLVKRTVNFDEPAAYHFYYSTGLGEPGTLLTTFPGYQKRETAKQNLVVRLTGGSLAAEDGRLRDPDGQAI